MFSKPVIRALTELSSINNTVLLRYPHTTVRTSESDVIAVIDVSKLDQDEFVEIGLNNNFKEFLSVFKLFQNDYEVLIKDHDVHIRDPKTKTKTNFRTDDIGLLKKVRIDVDHYTNVENTKKIDSIAEIDLSIEDIKNLFSATGVYKNLTELIISSNRSDELELTLGQTEKYDSCSDRYTIVKDCDVKRDFYLRIPIVNFKMIPMGNYKLSVKYNEERKAYRILLENKDFDGLSIILAVKVE